MNWLMFLAGTVFGMGIGMLVSGRLGLKRFVRDVAWTDEFLATFRGGLPSWKSVKQEYRPRHSSKVRRSTRLEARMKGWWAKTRPRDPKEVFRGA